MALQQVARSVLAAVVVLLCLSSTNSNGAVAFRHSDPLYSGTGRRSHGFRPDLAAALVARSNQARAADIGSTSAASEDDSYNGEGSTPATTGYSPPAECVSIASTSSCDPWTAGYYINTTELALVYGLADGSAPDAAYWDKLVDAMTGGGDLQAAIWAEWAQCLGYHGAPIQYFRTYVCLTDIFFYSSGCNPGATISPPLQPDVCNVYKEAVTGLIQDVEACPSLETLSLSLADAALQDVYDRRSFLLSADESCQSILNKYVHSSDAGVWGVTADQVSCGFGGNLTVANHYCEDVYAQYNQKPQCCDALGSGSSSYTPSFAPPTANNQLRTDSIQNAVAAAAGESAEGASASSSGDGVPVGAIVGGVFGGLVAIGGSVAGYAAYTKRNQSSRKVVGNSVKPQASVPNGGMQQVIDIGASGADYVTLPPGTRFVGILEFQPTNPDEMEVNEGDIIEGKIQFSDGWMKGYNHESQETGLFPSAVVKPLNS